MLVGVQLWVMCSVYNGEGGNVWGWGRENGSGEQNQEELFILQKKKEKAIKEKSPRILFCFILKSCAHKKKQLWNEKKEPSLLLSVLW